MTRRASSRVGAGATLAFAAALVVAPATAAAYTQWSAAVTLGGGGRLLPDARREGLVAAGLRADVLFGARDPVAPRVGPFVSAWSEDFDTLYVAAGVSVLAPVSSTTPLVFSLGGTWAALDDAESAPPVGVLGRVWWGSRSVNLHASYGMAVGLWIETRWMPASNSVDVLAGLDADIAFLSIPAVLLWNWLTH